MKTLLPFFSAAALLLSLSACTKQPMPIPTEPGSEIRFARERDSSLQYTNYQTDVLIPEPVNKF